MAEPAVSVQALYKKFRRGQQFDSLRDLFAAKLLPGRLRRAPRSTDFWALANNNFEVQPGEAFGIIGPNGAGKSTMLKILAGIMRPNRGTVEIRGRVSALIELGAGFHGDLTGRENIYLNASILGMSRRHVHAKFEEIVDFAGIRDFLDTPIKRYSSGMHARLGFAIAAHVDPQVLLVDEVLSVGDRVFRARCVEKMRDFLAQGAAVVFVSHDLNIVSRFCHRATVLSRGKQVFTGTANDAVGHYHQACTDPLIVRGPQETPMAEASHVRIRDPDGREVTCVEPGDTLSFEYDITPRVDIARPSYGLSVLRLEDHLSLFETSSTKLGSEAPPLPKGGRHRVLYEVQMNLPPGEYAIGYHVRERDALEYLLEEPYAARIMVEGRQIGGGMVHLAPRVSVDHRSAGTMAATVSAC